MTADLAVEGQVEADLAAAPAVEAEDRYRKRLAAARMLSTRAR